MFNIFTILFSTPPKIDASSIPAIYDTMGFQESMYLEGPNIQREIKKTRRGTFVRDFEGHVVTIRQLTEEPTYSSLNIISKAPWQKVENSSDLYQWLDALEVETHKDFNCQWNPESYIIIVRNKKFKRGC